MKSTEKSEISCRYLAIPQKDWILSRFTVSGQEIDQEQTTYLNLLIDDRLTLASI